jgi:hypothetical protein
MDQTLIDIFARIGADAFTIVAAPFSTQHQSFWDLAHLQDLHY